MLSGMLPLNWLPDRPRVLISGRQQPEINGLGRQPHQTPSDTVHSLTTNHIRIHRHRDTIFHNVLQSHQVPDAVGDAAGEVVVI